MNKWLFAYIQHPMLLAVHEDRGNPVIYERTPPAGAPDIQDYAGRIRRNLAALQKYPDLKLNYEFSGVELELLADHAPDIIQSMREMVKQRRIAFVGGDYSQPHGHLYGGELNFRQLEFGQRALWETVGYRAVSFFHQETWLHDQMPQLLRAFRFTTASVPLFPHTLESLPESRGPEMVGCDCHTYAPVRSDSIASWRGLDDTELPLLVTGVVRAGLDRRAVIQEDHKGFYRSSEFVVMAPDMDEIHDRDITFIRQYGDTVLFDEALEGTVRRQPPNWKTRLHTYWSYSEGEWAEAVNRQIRRLETALLAEEATAAVNGKAAREGAEAGWKTVLAAMHHDIHWLEITDLKHTYLGRLRDAEMRAADRTAENVEAQAGGAGDCEWVRVVNPLPFTRKDIVRLKRTMRASYDVFSADGTRLPALCLPSMDDEGVEVIFAASLPPLGTADFRIAVSAAPVTDGEPCDSARLRAGRHAFSVAADGTVSELLVGGANVLKGPGHDLHYVDGQGAPVGGPGRAGSMISYHNDMADVVRVSAPVGDIRTEIEYVASPLRPYVTVVTRFHFVDHAIGVAWRDWTKLNSYWPAAFGSIRHDIAFGAVDGRECVPLHAPSWLSVREGRDGQGLAVLNTGTPKHWVEAGVIGCVLAWGGSRESRIGVDFSSRRDVNPIPALGPFDLTLKGIQSITMGILPLAQGVSEADIARSAQCLNSPVTAFAIPYGDRTNHRRGDVDFSAVGLVCTAVFLKDGRLTYRFYEGNGETCSVEDLGKALGCGLHVTDLAGAPLDEVTPYRIGYLAAD